MLSGATLGVEVCNGHVDAIEALKSYEKFNDILADWLGLALKYAAKEGNVDVIEMLKNHRNFDNISPYLE